jgi:hypothetical protein
MDAAETASVATSFSPLLQLPQVAEKHSRMPPPLQAVQMKYVQEIQRQIECA